MMPGGGRHDRPGTPPSLLGLTGAEWVLAAGALALSAATHLLPARLRFPANLAVAALASRWAEAHGAGPEAQGMRLRDVPRGVVAGCAAGGLVSAPMIAGVALKRSRGLYRADHVVTASLPRAAYEVFLRIPLGTALAEEVVFRGALLGLLQQHHSPRHSAVLSACVFGLWHVVPTLYRIEANPVPRARPAGAQALWVSTSVVSTAAAGLGLAWLRLWSRSLVAPWLAHFAANAAGYAVAWLASRTSPPPNRAR